MIDNIQIIADQAVTGINAATDERSLEDARVTFLGKKGTLATASSGIKDVANEDKPAFGAALNQARTAINAALDAKTLELQNLADAKSVAGIDLTLPGRGLSGGKPAPAAVFLFRPVPKVL